MSNKKTDTPPESGAGAGKHLHAGAQPASIRIHLQRRHAACRQCKKQRRLPENTGSHLALSEQLRIMRGLSDLVLCPLFLLSIPALPPG
jgi:hypothetical protein